MARPFLKWAGGKTQLLPQLRAATPPHIQTYYEPFLGGGALFFALQREGRFERAVLTDLNDELINAFAQVRDAVGEVIAALRAHEMNYGTAPQRRADYFYDVRQNAQLGFPVERAARTIFLNKTCFNGLYRVNSQGEFNVPHGSYAKPTICDEDGLRAASAALQEVELRTADFECAIRDAQAGDFVYFDPPYVPVSDTSNFTAYTADLFGLGEQERLADAAAELAARGVRFLLSNSNHPDVQNLYEARGMSTRDVVAGRAINSVGAARGPVAEYLILPGPRPRRTPASTRARARKTPEARRRVRRARSRNRSRGRNL